MIRPTCSGMLSLAPEVASTSSIAAPLADCACAAWDGLRTMAWEVTTTAGPRGGGPAPAPTPPSPPPPGGDDVDDFPDPPAKACTPMLVRQPRTRALV